MNENPNKKLDYDYFDSDDLPEETPREESPEEREDREIEELVVVSPRDRYRDMVFAIIAGAVVVTIGVLWWLFYHPIVAEAQVTGRLMEVRCEGLLFKTYEAGMVSEQFITDTIKRKENDFNFSIDNDSLAYRLMRLQNTGKRITVTYKQYTAPLPWRGKSDVVATDVVEN